MTTMTATSTRLAVDLERFLLTLEWGAVSAGTAARSSSLQKAKAERQWCVTNVCIVVRVTMGGNIATT